jgi:hypothetical protein
VTSVPLVALLAVLVLVASACGRSGARDDARGATEAFLAAYTAGDGEAACAQLSREARESLERAEGSPCPRAVTQLRLVPGQVARVEVYVTNARVRLSTGESAFLSEEAGGWRLTALGCRPEDGAPTRHPLTCELEA